MWTLLVNGTFLDNLEGVFEYLIAIDTTAAYGSLLLFLMYVALSAMTVMNMLIGMLCEVVSRVQTEAEEDKAAKQLADTVLCHLKRFKVDETGLISKEAHGGWISKESLEQMLTEKRAVVALRRMNIDIGHLTEVQRMLFADITHVPLSTVLKLMLKCRGDVHVTFQHIADSHLFTRWSLRSEGLAIQKREDARFKQISNRVSELTAALNATSKVAV